VAQDVIEPLSIVLLASSGSLEAEHATGEASIASEMVPKAGEMLPQWHFDGIDVVVTSASFSK